MYGPYSSIRCAVLLGGYERFGRPQNLHLQAYDKSSVTSIYPVTQCSIPATRDYVLFKTIPRVRS